MKGESGHLAYSNFILSIIKTTTMMMGDLDYMNTFVIPYSNRGTDMAQESGPFGKLPFPYTSFLMLILFIILMPILLMNLLIGLAVGDIDAVRKNAHHKSITMQVNSTHSRKTKFSF